MRSSGILLNISSLPSEFGIGGFGKEIEKFADFLKQGDCKWWQVLPMTTIGLGNSPYSGVSAFAGNFLYIDPILLRDKGYITYEQCEQLKYHGSPYAVDYGFCYEAKRKAVEWAYESIMKNDQSVLYTFADEQMSWILDYALYMTIKELNDNKAWYDWEEKYKIHDNEAVGKVFKENAVRVGYYICEQYLFQSQWMEQKERLMNRELVL